MSETLIWWISVELFGLAAWPVAFRFFRHLPGRGYAFVKPLGLLLVAYPYWLLTSFGFLDNTQGAVVLVTGTVALLSWWLLGRARLSSVPSKDSERTIAVTLPQNAISRPGIPNGHAANPETLVTSSKESPLAWLREHTKLVVATELVFAVAFLLWVAVRAYMPEITATEKPMEFAFLNGILQSKHFPPMDPWLSGYAISYYYFGYIVVAMLTLFTGIQSSIAFNLAIALLFGLASTGAFGLAYDLIQGQFPSSLRPAARSIVYSLFAPMFLVVMGNLEGVFEVLHTKGIGSPGFWQWLDIKGLADASVNGSLVPTDNWWWWRASRVIHDVANGQTQEVIDEFPQFSFLLGDMHPHVLALPFVLMALAVALNVLRDTHLQIRNERFGFPFFSSDFLFIPLVIGALPFLNFWDILPYGFIVVAAFALARYRLENRWSSGATRDIAFFAVAMGLIGVVLFIPFYIGFQSQAGGLLPVLLVKTQLHQYLIMFGTFVFVFLAFLAKLVYENRTVPASAWWSKASPFVVGVLGFPLIIAALTAALVLVSPALQESARAAFPGSTNSVLADVLSAFFRPLAADPWLFVLLGLIIATILVLLRLRVFDLVVQDTSKTFVLLLMFTGFLLTFGVEFVFLRDVFGTRMNTVFKFYFQTWTLFSVAAAFALFYLADHLKGMAKVGWWTGFAVLTAASLIYPVLGIPNRADDFDKTPTLDGIAWIETINPSDYAGIAWLKSNAPRGSHILESIGRQYSYDDRMSMATGLPTVLGWAGHEDQWRGGSQLYKNDLAGIDRPGDVARIYQTTNAQEALTYIDKYAINFVVVGQTERNVYALTKAQVDKFGQTMRLVFENGDLRIYAR